MKKIIVSCMLCLFIGCVGFTVKSGYIITKDGTRVEFNDSFVGFGNDEDVEIWKNGTHYYFQKSRIKEMKFIVK